MAPVATATLVLLALTASAGPAAEPPVAIDGTWTVDRVEFGGEPVDGLKGAELRLSGGKKTFRLPSGAVESGAFSVDASASPPSIDATTEGKSGTQRGIYAVEGRTLKMCFAQEGGERPRAFATRAGSDLILIVLERAAGDREGAPAPVPPAALPAQPAAKLPESRPFRLGFTGFVPDLTPEAVAAARKFVRENGDVIAHHFEGVPWAEVLAGTPFAKEFLAEWEGKRAGTPPGGKVYLAVSPGRGDLKVAEKAQPIPAELRGKPYDDPLVKKAYLAYCRRAADFFRPDYLAIGIEVNELHDAGEKTWQAYVDLHRHVYTALKKDHPGLPVFASFTLHNLWKKQGGMLKAFEALMEWNDLVAVSYYPFFVEDAKRLSALDWMGERFDRFQKPYAMVETNDAAERLAFPKSGLVIAGSPEQQLRYHEKLLALAHERRFRFVIDFIHQDYDRLWKKIEAGSPELFMAWRDCGLLDEEGRPRPALGLWQAWFALPLRE